MKVMQGKAWERAGEHETKKQRETEALVPAVSKQDQVFELQVMNLKIQFLYWLKQALNVGFVICIAGILTNTSITSALRSQQHEAGSGPRWISGSAKDASFSIFGFTEFTEILTHLQRMSKHPSPIH